MLAHAVLLALAVFPLSHRPRQDDAAVHDQLRALRTEIETAFNRVGASGKREDLDAVLAHVSERVVLTAMNGACAVGKQGVVEYFERTMVGPDRTVESVHHAFTPEGLSVLYGGDTAVGYGSSVGRYELTSGRAFEADVRWTCTMIKESERWLVASFQFAPSIFDNPVLAQTLRYLYWVGAGAALAGLVLGFGGARVLARRR